jgi:RimJ/RimL family protein N-acetyltransferase
VQIPCPLLSAAVDSLAEDAHTGHYALVESQVREGDLLLRSWAKTDASAVNDIVASSRSDLDIWLPGLTAELADFDRYVDRRAQSATDGNGWYYCIALHDEIVGQCSVELRDSVTAEIGYWIRSDRTHAGIATKAVRALCRAAATYGVETMIIRCDQGNVRSAAVAMQAGFDHVATAVLDVAVEEMDLRTGIEMKWNRVLNRS